MKKVALNLLFFFTLFSFACSSGIPQHCPSYYNSYGKERHKVTKGVNKNIFANGIRKPYGNLK